MRFTGRAVLNWTPQLDFTDQTLGVASYSHGYKAGGANPPGAAVRRRRLARLPGRLSPIHPLTFKPEYIEAFEFGSKNTLLDGSLTLNGDVFYYNYTDYQISEIVDRTAINTNFDAPCRRTRRLKSSWEPLPGLKFNFAGGWEDTAAARGDSGIDLMDRTAGSQNSTCTEIPNPMPNTSGQVLSCNSGWMVVKPFVTFASNCILPDLRRAGAI